MRVSFKTWDQVRQLTSKLERGPARVTVPGPATLVPTDPVAISFVLPQEITVRIAGEVHAVRPRDGARPDVVIELVGLTADVAARLNALADAGDPAPAPRRPTGYLQVSPRLDARTRPARGSDPALARGSEQGLRVSEILRNNQRLRTQIEGLASKMTPRPETDD